MSFWIKLTSCSAFGLAAAFYWFFMFTKHDPALSQIASFLEDPYDAVGSFCMIISILLGVLSLVRAFRRPQPDGLPYARIYLARTQVAIATGVLVTLTADAVASARHFSQWFGKLGALEIIGLMTAMALLSILLILIVRKTLDPFRSLDQAALGRDSQWAVGISLLSVVVLAIFPEEAIRSAPMHFITILLAFILTAAPQAAWAVALVPCHLPSLPSARRLWLFWALIAFVGIAIGVFALAGELSEGGGSAAIPLGRRMMVYTVFLGAGMSTMLVAFTFLGKPLGLFRNLSSSPEDQVARAR